MNCLAQASDCIRTTELIHRLMIFSRISWDEEAEPLTQTESPEI
ncbi:hypothetical protein SN31241_6690 [Salmonella enterica subsp. enterica serovar Newport str. USMARC-S3124.1]|nr:hypothetical protein SN31241_6690 [Salmonella enterica subsp. enterica serovar Newport str. USMARC-S3124.1]